MSKTCGDCISFSDGECTLMCDALCKMPVSADTTPCPIGKFEPKPSPELALHEPENIIGLRKFADLVGVKLASVQDAIDAGRITAVMHTRQGRKLIKDEALEQWNATRIAGNNNRAGELPGDRNAKSDNEPTPGAMKTQFEAELAELRGIKLRLEIDELEGKLHSGDDIEQLWVSQLARFRSRILAIPAKVAPGIVSKPNRHHSEVAEILERECYAALAELASFNFIES